MFLRLTFETVLCPPLAWAHTCICQHMSMYTHRHNNTLKKKRVTVHLNSFQTFIPTTHVRVSISPPQGAGFPFLPAYIGRVSNLTHIIPLAGIHRCGERGLMLL